MKKIILMSALIVGIFACMASASQQVVLGKPNFAPQGWSSKNSNDQFTIQYGGSDMYKTIEIQVYNSSAGVNISNCGSVKHINPGSVAFCPIGRDNPIVTLTSDRDDLQASGIYQVE